MKSHSFDSSDENDDKKAQKMKMLALREELRGKFLDMFETAQKEMLAVREENNALLQEKSKLMEEVKNQQELLLKEKGPKVK